MRKIIQFTQTRKHQLSRVASETGFTLLEVLLVVFMVGILAALGIPSWISLLNNSRLKNARANVFEAIQEAKTQAQKTKTSRTVSFQENEDNEYKIQWAVHASDVDNPSNWKTIDIPSVEIDLENTDLGGYNTSPWSLTFNDKGEVDIDQLGDGNTDPGRIIISLGDRKKCVIVKTILGAMVNEDGENCLINDTP